MVVTPDKREVTEQLAEVLNQVLTNYQSHVPPFIEHKIRHALAFYEASKAKELSLAEALIDARAAIRQTHIHTDALDIINAALASYEVK